MPRRYGPPRPKYKTGPKCDGCPWRSTSFGYAPATGPDCTIDDTSGIPHESDEDIHTEFLFLLEALGPDEVAQGRNAVGPTGKAFNKILHGNTPIRRGDVTIANVVRCRPVEWVEKNGKQVPATLGTGDHITEKPSPQQVGECGRRYTEDLLRRFKGKYIVALGKVPAQYMLGRPIKISEYRGTIFEAGTLVDCTNCDDGRIAQKPKRCKSCAGRGTLKCTSCGRTTKHLKRCEDGVFPACQSCDPVGSGLVPRPSKPCRECGGSGRVPEDPDNPFICERLREGQLLFLSYHPAALFRNPGLWTVVERDFSRLANLEGELVEVSDTTYDEYPPVGATSWIGKSSPVSIDIETSGGLDPSQGSITVIGATDRIRYGAAFDPSDERVRDLLASDEIVGQNFVLYDWWWLRHHGYSIPEETKILDTRYFGKLLNPDTPNDLTYLAGEFASPPMRGYWKTKNNYRDNIERVVSLDVDATLRVYVGQMEEISRRGQESIVNDYIVPLSRVVFDMRCGGMRVDRDKMDETRKQILAELDVRRQDFPWGKADGSTGSENQHGKVQEYLYSYLELPVQTKRGSGKRTSNREALEELLSRLEQDHHSVRHVADEKYDEAVGTIKNLLKCRDLSKLESSFLRYKLSGTDFIHPALNMGGSTRGKHESGRGTATWRFSCMDPNAQQVPKSARGIFIPDEDGWEMASIDLTQAEVVGFLWYAQEWAVLERILKHGMDAHRALAEKIAGRELPNAGVAGHPDKKIRDECKNTTFAILYGETARTTALRLKRPIKEIEEVREAYFRMLPGVDEYRKKMIHHAMDYGYVESPFGFRRYLYVTSEHGRAANQAGNMPIQNIPPVVLGRAMIGIHREMPKPARLLMQVHDELVFTYPPELRREATECVLEWMRAPVPELYAPQLGMAGGLRFNVDIERGPSWGEMKTVKEEEYALADVR